MQCYIGDTGVTAEEISTRRPTFVPPWPSAPLLSPSPPLSLYPVVCPPTLESLLTANFFQPPPPPPHSLVDLPPQVEATRGQSPLSIYEFPITSTMTPRRRCRKAHARTDDPPCSHASQCPQGRNLDSSGENIKQMRYAHAGRGTWAPDPSLSPHPHKTSKQPASPDLPARALHPDCMA